MKAPERTAEDTEENHRAVEAVRKALHDQRLPTTRYCPHTATWDGKYYTCTQDHHEGRTHEMRTPQGALMATWVSPRLFVYELPEANYTTSSDPHAAVWEWETGLFGEVWAHEAMVGMVGDEYDPEFPPEKLDELERDALRILAAIAEHRARKSSAGG